jgi:RNA polymerase sigma-70 factor (ECF subfamily)
MGWTIEELCGRCKEGDAEAASELLALHYERIFGYFRRLCGNEADASDLTQKAFCKVWQAIGSFQGKAQFATWVHGIAHHVYVDWRRVKNRFDSPSDEWWLTCVAGGPSPFEQTAEREVAHQLYALVEELEEASRETVHLHYYQGLTIAETSEALGIATSTVKYRLRSALDLIRARLSKTEKGEEYERRTKPN